MAKLIKLTYIQIGRYVANKSNPSSDVLQRLAHALDTTTDFLMKGTEEEAVAAQLRKQIYTRTGIVGNVRPTQAIFITMATSKTFESRTTKHQLGE